jgi:hypothetical protein
MLAGAQAILTVRKKSCLQGFGRETSLKMATWSIEEIDYVNVTEM